MSIIIVILTIIIFIFGLYVYSKYNDPLYKEGFETKDIPTRCPNMLIQKDSKFYLYNSKLAKVPGVNPIEFSNLEEYVEFLDWQKSQGIKCPVLYLQRSFDAQGKSSYKIRPSISEPQGGLPPSPSTYNPSQQSLLVDASHNDHPFNKNSYPGYDTSSYYVGEITPLDKMNEKSENMLYSPDAMDPNWGGPKYTQSLIDKGYYKGNTVDMYVEHNK
jgi:hypothetical protein